MSGPFAAIVAYIFGEKFTSPSISELIVTSDNFVLARHTGEPCANEIIAPLADLQRNWSKLLDVAGLTEKERMEAMALFEAQVGKDGAVAKKEPPPSAPPPDYPPPSSQN